MIFDTLKSEVVRAVLNAVHILSNGQNWSKLCGQRSLVGYSPQGRKELEMTERLHFLSLSVEQWVIQGRFVLFTKIIDDVTI